MAAAAGFLARVPCHPLDTCKTVALANEGHGQISSFASAFQQIAKQEGARGFYRGFGISVIGSAPGVALYLTSYESVKRRLNLNSKPLEHLIAGFAAETISCVFWVPIDVVKERLQSQTPAVQGRYTGSADAVRSIFRNEGVWGLYRGYLSTLASFGPYSAFYFMFFEFNMTWLKPYGHSEFVTALASGFGANIFACALTNPLEIVKTRLQVQRAMLKSASGDVRRSAQFSYQYDTMVQGLAHLFRSEGASGWIRGLSARVFYTAPNAALTFALYAHLKEVSRR